MNLCAGKWASGLIGSVCAEEFVAKLLFMGNRRGDYRDLCEVGGKGGSE